MIKVKFMNWWKSDKTNEFFFLFLKNFLKKDVILDEKPDILFFSVFGNKKNVLKFIAKHNCISIFFTGECTSHPNHNSYDDYCLDFADISLGFKELNNKNYLRFPLWMTYINLDTLNMGKNILNFNKIYQGCKDKFCCILNNHDKFNTRTNIFQELSNYKKVDSGGGWEKNINYTIGNSCNDKYNWIKDYKFNICSESMLEKGYITEKIFECLISGCIPIYKVNNMSTLIEPDIINQDCILKFTDNNVKDVTNKIVFLDNNNDEYCKFKQKNVFKETAVEKITNKYKALQKLIEVKLIDKNPLHIFICHYTKLEKRKKHILNQLNQIKNIKITFIDEYDAEDVNQETDSQYFLENKEEWSKRCKWYSPNTANNSRKLRISEKSLALKHFTALKKIKNMNIDYGLIIEDDAVFCNNFLEKITQKILELPDDWDLYFPNSYKNMFGKGSVSPNLKNIYKKKNPSSAYTISYLINKKCCDSIISTIEKNKIVLPIDWEYNWMFKILNLNVYHNKTDKLIYCANFPSSVQK